MNIWGHPAVLLYQFIATRMGNMNEHDVFDQLNGTALSSDIEKAWFVSW